MLSLKRKYSEKKKERHKMFYREYWDQKKRKST